MTPCNIKHGVDTFKTLLVEIRLIIMCIYICEFKAVVLGSILEKMLLSGKPVAKQFGKSLTVLDGVC